MYLLLILQMLNRYWLLLALRRKRKLYYREDRQNEETDLARPVSVLDVYKRQLVGYPSVGKSSIIAQVSAARPEIAAYHFTTLSPVLGVVRLDEERSFVLADIPGLIEGAHEGVGLGHDFLRHVERTKVLLHIVDVAGVDGRDPIEDFDKINTELALSLIHI